MALSGKVETEIEIETSAAKFFNLFLKQLNQLQYISTEKIHKAKVHEGDWHSIGSVKHWTYTIDGKVTTAKEKIEEIDEANKALTFSLFDEDIGKQYKTLKAKLKVSDKDNGGAVAKWVYEYEKLNENIPTPNGYIDFTTKVTKDVDAHLLTTA